MTHSISKQDIWSQRLSDACLQRRGKMWYIEYAQSPVGGMTCNSCRRNASSTL